MKADVCDFCIKVMEDKFQVLIVQLEGNPLERSEICSSCARKLFSEIMKIKKSALGWKHD